MVQLNIQHNKNTKVNQQIHICKTTAQSSQFIFSAAYSQYK